MMATFLVERYWPDVTGDAVEAATGALRAGGLDIVETIVAGPDEVCLWYIEAASATAVSVGFAAAHVPFDRLSAAMRVPC